MDERDDYADGDGPEHPPWLVILAYLNVGGLVGGSLAAVGFFTWMSCELSRPL
jgi:hypothetical protein